jgi:hypothetical protein
LLPGLSACYACGKPVVAAGNLTVLRSWDCSKCGGVNPNWRQVCHACSHPSTHCDADTFYPIATYSEAGSPDPTFGPDPQLAAWNQGDPAAWQAATLKLREAELDLHRTLPQPEADPPLDLRGRLRNLVCGVSGRWRRGSSPPPGPQL